ncbi:hypothetical protein B0H14DRAFT_3710458 [Mycena olivaceomarginata]|nr:hypothetical protein B0H14DRAFT_3710458 [Mycena olivaceomarginata]
MKSSSELRTHIDELKSAIDTQKRVLRDLENKRSQAQSELNSRLDPMAHLPVEIASDIFLHCVPTTPRPGSLTAPMVFSNICQPWRSIALSTPFLWAGIRLEFLPRGAKFAKLCRLWIDRARTLPLSFSLHGSLDRRIETLVQRYRVQLQNLKLFVRTGDDLQRLRMQGLLHLLRTLTIGADETNSVEADFLNADECLEILRTAPELVECAFDDVFYEQDIYSAGSPLQPLTHTSLRALRLGMPQSRAIEGYHGNSAFILQYITLPSLKHLEIADFDITIHDFISFLTRSAPPLASLRMVIPTADWQPHVVVEYLHPIPSLADLELFYLNPDDEADDDSAPFRTFLEVLGAAENFLPNLRNLTLWACFSERKNYFVKDGMQIHVGP